MSWTGKIVGGVSLILLGLGGAIYGLLFYYSQIKNIQLCNSLPDAFNQLNTNACNRIPDFLITGIIFVLVGTIMLIIGIILIRSGQKQK